MKLTKAEEDVVLVIEAIVLGLKHLLVFMSFPLVSVAKPHINVLLLQQSKSVMHPAPSNLHVDTPFKFEELTLQSKRAMNKHRLSVDIIFIL
jgi:hypothetical protein